MNLSTQTTNPRLCLSMLITAVAVAVAPISRAAEEPIINRDIGVTKMDKTFAREAAHGVMRDISLAAAAQHGASTEKLRKFAGKIHGERSAAFKQLQQLTKQTGLRMPTLPDAHMKRQVKELGSLAGREFDKRFLELIAASDYIRFFVFELNSGAEPVDPRVKRFASEQLPILRKDAQRARLLLRDYR